MNRQSHFGRALAFHLQAHAMTQKDLAARAGVRQSTIARMIAGNRRPDVASLEAICSSPAWNDVRTELALLIEHLRDEITRSGRFLREIDLRAIPDGRRGHKPDELLERACELICSEATAHKEFRSFVIHLASMVHDLKRRGRSSPEGDAAA